MPKRFAVSSSNWSNLTTWDSGDVLGLPTASDDVWVNNQIVNINTSFIVNSINNNGGSTNTTGLVAPMVSRQVIPNMTSFDTPEGIAFANTFAGIGNEPWRAFDGVASTAWGTAVTFTTLPSQVIGYQFTSPRNIKRYGIKANTVNTVPNRWTFEGSNDGTTYTVLDTVTSSITTADAVITSSLLANTASFTFYRLNVSLGSGGVNNFVSIKELEMTESTSSATGGASGGTYNFDTANVSASIISPTAPVSGLVANNSISVAATTGTVTISAPSGAFVGTSTSTTQLINHSGNCNLVLTGSFVGGPATSGGSHAIAKSSTGTITILGNVSGSIGGGFNNRGLNSTAGNTVVIGNVRGGSIGAGNSGINQSAGNLTVIGNVAGGPGADASTTQAGIGFAGAVLTITGSVSSGTATNANPVGIDIQAGTPTINISGSVTGGTAAGISAISSTVTLTVNGNVTAGTNAVGVSLTSTSTATILGNLTNVNGINAFYGPNLRLASGSLQTWAFTTPTGVARTLFTQQQIGDQPLTSNVRNGISYGNPTRTGTMIVPPSGSVALGVAVDTGTGSASLNATQVASTIWNTQTSTLTTAGSIGERIKNAATVASTGAQIAAMAGGN